MSPTISVNLQSKLHRSYPVRIQSGSLELLHLRLREIAGAGPIFVITDSTVKRLYGKQLVRNLGRKGIEVGLLDFPSGERSKQAGTVSTMYSKLLRLGVKRDSVIVALGGGVVGDVAGYVASTVLRGVPYIQVPTSLLAQVDSSIGGKVGIDHTFGKNLIGAFYQPREVIIDPLVLRTLPEEEFRNGLAEVVKIAVALDGRLFSLLEKHAHRIRKNNSPLMSEILIRSVGLKASVVQRDEFERGLRKTLNAGHTIGHALEASTSYALKHGAAVAIGLAAEAELAVHLQLMGQKDFSRLLTLMRRLKLPTVFPRIKRRDRFFAALSRDKKSEGDRIRFVIPAGIGRSVVGVDVPDILLRRLVDR